MTDQPTSGRPSTPSPAAPSAASATPSPERQLTALRIIWAALLMGQAAFFLIIALVIWPQGRTPIDASVARMLFYVLCAMLLTILPVTFIVRGVMYRKGMDDRGNVGAAAYASGNIIFWAGCEGVAMFGLVGALLTNGPWPYLVVTIIAVAMQLMTFPTGGPLRQSA